LCITELLTGTTSLITLGGGGQIDQELQFMRESRKRGKTGWFHFFLHLHHQNNRFENIYIFHLPLFNSVAKKLFLVRKNIGGAFVSPPFTPEFMPMGPVLLQTVEKCGDMHLIYSP